VLTGTRHKYLNQRNAKI